MGKNRKKHHSILQSCLNSAIALAMFLSPIATIVAEDTGMPASTEAPAESAAPAEPVTEEPVITTAAPAEEAPAEEQVPAEETAPVQEAAPAPTPAATPAPAPAATPAPTPAAVSEPTAVPAEAPEASAVPVVEEAPAPAESAAPVETAEAAAPEATMTPEPSATPEATAAPEPEYLPAGSFNGSTSQMTVTVSYGENTFRTGTEMKVAYVSRSEAIAAAEQTASEDQEVIDAMAVDITFIGSNGNEVQPEGAVSVSLEPRRALASTETSTQEVLHKEDNGNVQVVGNADVSAAGAEFSADHFSIYVISSKDTPAIATYIFHDADGKAIDEGQKVKDGETVYAPTTPEKTGSKFLGWSYTQGVSSIQEGDPGEFGTLAASVSTTGEVHLYPVFQQAYYVFFLDNQGRVSTTKEGVSGDVISAEDVAIPLDSTHSVTGWYTEAEPTKIVKSVTLSDHNVTLYPKVEEGHYLYFSSGKGASYVKPVFVAAGKNTVKPEAPTRPGYTFKHWSVSEDGSEYAFGSTISEDTTLYAVWEASPDTKYTVIFWKQSVNDSKNAEDTEKTYDYAESATRIGKTGSYASPKYADQNKGYTGFSYNSSKSTSVTINGDGTTILNVYYDRNLLTIEYYTWKNGWWGGNWSLYKTYTGLYGQTLAQNEYTWPEEYAWYDALDQRNNPSGTRLTFLDSFILRDNGTVLNLYGEKPSGDTWIRHYKQNLDGTYSYDRPTNETETSLGWNGSTWTFTEKYQGFTVDSFIVTSRTPTNSSDWNSTSAGNSTSFRDDLYIRYARNSYKLAYYNYNCVSKEESVLFEKSLSGFSSYKPSRPDGLPDAYTFQGWFKDKECTVPFDFNNSTMPSNDVVIYAKWAAPTYTGTVHMNLEGTGNPMQLTISYGSKINENDMPTVKDSDGNIIKEGSSSYTVTVQKGNTWAGWATKSGNDYIIYNFSTEVYSDITLYPYYINGEKYTVTYSLGEGTGTAPTDSKQYSQNAYADIQPASGITPPEGKTFLYWSYGTDKYYPGDKVKITGNLELTAVYGKTSPLTSITYHSNYPEGSELEEKTTTVDGRANNTAITLEKADFTAPAGYYFAYWMDASGYRYDVGSKIGIDNDNTSANDLYAVWEQKKEITLTANSGTFIYDGTEHTSSGVVTDTFVIDGVTYTVSGYTTESPVKTDAGTYTNNISGTYAVKGNNGIDVTDHFTIQTVDGSLTISKRTVHLKSESASKQYDGTALTAPTVTVSGDEFVTGEVTDLKATGTITESGSVTNEIKYTEQSGFKADNYTISKEEGTLTITQNTSAIKVTAESASKTYDGTPLTKNSYTITGLPEGFTAVVMVSGSITDAGTAENKVTSVTVKKGDQDVTSQFSRIENVNGTLTVNKRTVHLKSESASKQYDGTALTAPNVTVSEDGFVTGEITDLKAVGTITESGSVTNEIKYTEKSGFKADNYTITMDEGTLTITQNENEIVVDAKNASKIYDGTALTESAADVTGLPEGYTAEVNVTGSIIDAGTADNVVGTVVIKDASGNDVTDQFKTITKNNGTLTVTKRTVTLTSDSVTREYDGTALTAPNVTVGGERFVDGEVTDLKATGTITTVGSVTNTIAYTEGTSFKAENYEIKKNEGKLTITANTAAIEVKADSDSKTYDGTALTKSSYSVTGLPEGFAAEAAVTGSITDTGTADNVVTSVVIRKDGEDVTDQFSNITKTNGTLTVTVRKVTLTSGSASKAYDGVALTRPEVTITGDGFVTGEVSDVKATGSITKIGSATNTITYNVNNGFKAGNYEITKTEGTLTITANTAAIKVTADSASKTYDGTPLTKNTYKIEGLPNGFTEKVTVSGTSTDAGTAVNEVKSAVILKDGKDVTDQFTNIEIASGTLTVNKRTVNLKSDSASKVFDGTALTAQDVTVTGDGFVTGEVTDLKAVGTITKAGSVKNEIRYTEKSGFKADNYTITKDEGTLTITQNENEIVVNAKNASRTYDGTALTEGGSEVIGLPNGYAAEVTVTGSITDVGTAENKVTSVVIKKGDEDVTDQFKTITKNNGTLTITKRDVTLTSESQTREYNGIALTAPNVTVGGDGFVNGEVTDIKATGTITKAGSAKNPITYTEGTGFKAGNYEIRKTEGTLTVTANTAVITVTAGSDSKTYDGDVLTKSTYTINGLPAGFTPTVMVSGSITSAGTADNVVTSVVIRKEGEDVTNQFSNIRRAKGTLTVTKRTVNLKSESASKQYDGTALTAPIVIVSGDGFVTGEVTDLKAVGTITKTGSVKNPIEYTEGRGFSTENYEIRKEEGTLTITTNAAAITVTADSDSKVYDGTALTKNSCEYAGLPEGFTVSAIIRGSITDAGTAENKVTSATIKKGDEDVTDQFSSISTENGTLTVTPRKVMLTSASASKVYDGTALTAPEVTVSGDQFVEGEVSNLKAVGTITDVGTEENRIAYDKKLGFKAGNYEITEHLGTLSILAADISDERRFEVESLNDLVYNGRDQAQEPDVTDKDSEKTLVKDKDYTLTFSEDVKNVGEVAVTVKGIGNYTGTVERTYRITPASILIVTPDAEKEYDGTPLTAAGTIEGLVNGETVSFAATGSQISVGNSENTYSLVWDGTASESNYTVEAKTGTLTVIAADISNADKFTVSQPEDVVYNGLEQKQPVTVERVKASAMNAVASFFSDLIGFIHADADDAVLLEGTDYTLAYSENLIDAGTVTITVTGIGNYTGTVERTYQIIPAPLTITTGSASKTYDGKALTNAEAHYEGLMTVRDSIIVTATGTQTAVGSSANGYAIDWGNTLKENYKVTEALGTLTVTPAPAPSTTPTPSTPAPTPYAPETGGETPYTPVTAAVPYTPYTGARTPYTPNTGRPYTPNTSDDGILRWLWMLGGSMILAAASYEALRKSGKH